MRWIWLLSLLAAACSGGHHAPPACVGPACECGPTALDCGNGCIDVASDAANCGACGHDCGGAECAGGVCLPESLAVVPNAPADQLVVDGDDLVFATRGQHTSTGAVYRVKRTDGETTAVYRGLADFPSVAVAPDHSILVADSRQVGGCDAAASSGEIVSLGSDASVVSADRRCVGQLTVTPAGLAWAENNGRFIGGGAAPTLVSLAATAPPGTQPTTLGQLEVDTAQHVVNVGDTLLWVDDSVIMESVNGAAATTVASAPSHIIAFAADATDLAYITDGGQLVVRSRATGDQKTLADNLPAGSLAIDDHFVYAGSMRAVTAIERDTGAQRELGTGAGAVLAGDDTYLYVLRDIERGAEHQTEVARIRKPASPLVDPNIAPVCMAPVETCSPEGACTDIRDDLANCGGCGVACAADETCDGGSCTCNANDLVCNGACVDPQSDANNCGSCGRGCAGGTCVDGGCTEVQLAPYAQTAIHDATGVYYAINSQLRRIDAATLANTLVTDVSGPLNFLHYLAQDATHVYMTGDLGQTGADLPSSVYAIAKTGATSPTQLYTNRTNLSLLAVGPSSLFWIENTNTLVYAAADGSGIKGTFSASALYTGAADDITTMIATAGTKVYWLLSDPNVNTGAIVQVDTAATQPRATLLATLDFTPYAVATVGTTLYLAGGWPVGKLVSMPAAGGPVTTLLDLLDRPHLLTATPGGGFVWAEGDFPVRLYELPAGGVIPEVIQTGNNTDELTDLSLDAARLFTVSGNGLFVMQR